MCRSETDTGSTVPADSWREWCQWSDFAKTNKLKLGANIWLIAAIFAASTQEFHLTNDAPLRHARLHCSTSSGDCSWSILKCCSSSHPRTPLPGKQPHLSGSSSCRALVPAAQLRLCGSESSPSTGVRAAADIHLKDAETCLSPSLFLLFHLPSMSLYRSAVTARKTAPPPHWPAGSSFSQSERPQFSGIVCQCETCVETEQFLLGVWTPVQ